VIKDKKTTYKKVATQLIDVLKANDSNSYLDSLQDISDEMEDDDPPLSKCTPNKKGSSTLDKGEKNIRRRVYDALNVQFAAGVLVKNDKYIQPNYECPEFMRIFNMI